MCSMLDVNIYISICVLIECLKEMERNKNTNVMKLSSSGRDIAQGDRIVAVQNDVESKISLTNQGMYILYMNEHTYKSYILEVSVY